MPDIAFVIQITKSRMFFKEILPLILGINKRFDDETHDLVVFNAKYLNRF